MRLGYSSGGYGGGGYGVSGGGYGGSGGGYYRAADQAAEEQMPQHNYNGAQEVRSLQSPNMKERATKLSEIDELHITCEINIKTNEICDIYDRNPMLMREDIQKQCTEMRDLAKYCKLLLKRQ